jgi:exodeoxyribonuclease VII large subunit
VYRVAELVRLASRALEGRFGDVWVEGEVSGYRPQQSGHAYFALKDADALLQAVMFRSALGRLRFRLADGQKVRARGRLSIYEGSGKFQMIVEALEPVGLGALQLAFEQLKRKLEAEGLFSAERKRPLPFLPRRIGVATSASGAVIRDIIRVAARRGRARLLLAPCAVQGEAAPDDVVRALAALQRVPDVDLIIVGRGGGSLEDLAAFNDERVARAIAACRVPVISAVGHEVDYTIADFVADRRAATPSQAAEIAVAVHDDLARDLGDLRQRLTRAARRQVADAGQRLDEEARALAAAAGAAVGERRRLLTGLEGRLAAQHPRARLARDRAQLVALTHRLERPLADRLAQGRRALGPLEQRLHAAMQQALVDGRRQVEGLPPRLHAAMHKRAAAARHGLEALMGALHALSPLRVLDRGYGLVRDPRGHVVTDAAELAVGDRIAVRLARGEVGAVVERVIERVAEAGEADDPDEGTRA